MAHSLPPLPKETLNDATGISYTLTYRVKKEF